MADIIWSENGRLGPVSDALSARQKFQRAFAQNFLCPYADVLEYCGAAPTPNDIAAAATHFHVSERSVVAVLGNNGHAKEDSFLEMVGSA